MSAEEIATETGVWYFIVKELSTGAWRVVDGPYATPAAAESARDFHGRNIGRSRFKVRKVQVTDV